MQQIIISLADKYSLTKAEVMAEIESVFAVRLTNWYRLEVMVFFREDLRLEAVVYNNSGGVLMYCRRSGIQQFRPVKKPAGARCGRTSAESPSPWDEPG